MYFDARNNSFIKELYEMKTSTANLKSWLRPMPKVKDNRK